MEQVNNNILILGASSDIGIALVRKIEKTLPKSCLYLTKFTTKGKISVKSKEEFVVDFGDEVHLQKLLKQLPDLDISHLIQIQGAVTSKDTLEEFDLHLHRSINMINLEATIVIVSKVLEQMKDNQFGRIVLISTASAEHGGGLNSFNYGLSKHGLNFLTVHLAKYYTKYNVLSNCVSPGFIDTKVHALRMERSKQFLEERAKSIGLGRSGRVEEVADLMYFLAFENTFISGQNIKIDGADFI